ncbi:hypothetical protein [Sulfurospirillum sp. 1612]|uniref:hypothetical protein n=1 Tax=Sulfurospirillum sp. 1612 TaxID=3094835 RepID=UPI002F945B34
MKRLVLGFVMLAVSVVGLSAANLSAKFTDSIWNQKEVPKSEVCSNYNTKPGSTPSITLDNIPANTSAIVLAFSDESFKGMSDGGHGIISYKLGKNTTHVIIPSIPGETFDLPAKFSVVEKHRGGKYGKTEGAYLAPCSGGKGHVYSVLIKAVDDAGKTLGSTRLTLGIF